MGDMFSPLMAEIGHHLMTLHQSDFCGQTPSPFGFIVTSLCHIAIGAASYRWPCIACAWVSKEIFADIPNCDFARIVIADSAADMAFLALGLWLVQWHLTSKARLR